MSVYIVDTVGIDRQAYFWLYDGEGEEAPQSWPQNIQAAPLKLEQATILEVLDNSDNQF